MEKAEQCFSHAAKMGNVQAAKKYAQIQQLRTDASQLKQQMQPGDRDALLRLGQLYIHGIEGAPLDKRKDTALSLKLRIWILRKPSIYSAKHMNPAVASKKTQSRPFAGCGKALPNTMPELKTNWGFSTSKGKAWNAMSTQRSNIGKQAPCRTIPLPSIISWAFTCRDWA